MSDPWMHHMRQGEFERAWQISDAVLQSRAGTPCWHLPRHFQYFWDGRPIDGQRVLVRCYHGLGDTLQFIRYAPLLRSRAREVIVWAQPRLLPVLRGVRGVDRWLPLHDGEVGIEFDLDVELMELPYIFRTTVESIPADVPYLDVTPAPLPPSTAPRVGIVWRAGEWSEDRSVPFEQLAPLLDVPVTWYILQGQPGVDDCPAGFGIRAGNTDILELARVIGSLDLVITIDSMTAHLAGALGARVWTLLPAVADWRWMLEREDSLWYPTMRLFRQREAGEWRPVIERVVRELRAVARRPSAT
jgi:hypothetical protein